MRKHLLACLLCVAIIALCALVPGVRMPARAQITPPSAPTAAPAAISLESSIAALIVPLIPRGAWIPADEFLAHSYAQQVRDVEEMANENPVRAWNFLKQFTDASPGAFNGGHALGHVIGDAMYKEYGFAGIRFCTPEYSWGCFHGITEMIFAREGYGALGTISAACSRYFPSGSDDDLARKAACIHGAGHGLYLFFDGNVHAAYEGCETFEPAFVSSCYQGIFMERSLAITAHGAFDKNPWLFCADTTEASHDACATFMPMVVVNREKEDNPIIRTQDDMKALMSGCAQASSAHEERLCVRGIGIMLNTLYGHYADASAMIGSYCSMLPDGLRAECVSGATIWKKF